MWSLLRAEKTGFKFKRQVPVLTYILDFYCAEAMVCVETDGEQHLQRLEHDAVRDSRLSELGILTIRVPSLDLFEDTHMEASRWISKIVATCQERTERMAHESRKQKPLSP